MPRTAGGSNTTRWAALARKAGARFQAAMPPVRTDSQQLPGLLGAAAAALSVVGVYDYFTGWVYAYFYYKDFGVSLLSLDMPLQYFFTYSYTVVNTGRGATLIVVLLGAVYMYAVKRLGISGLIGLLIVAFPLLFLAARSVSHIESARTRTLRAIPVRLLFKNPEQARFAKAADKATASTSLSDPELLDVNKRGNLNLLLETRDRLIVFYQPSSLGGSMPEAYVFSLMRSDLQWSMVIAR
ncbi:MAG: hypothetical protein ABSG65_20185 [Bryobacteraceae bacterium]